MLKERVWFVKTKCKFGKKPNRRVVQAMLDNGCYLDDDDNVLCNSEKKPIVYGCYVKFHGYGVRI